MSRILVLERHKHLRQLYLHELKQEGYEVVLAADAGEALEKLEHFRPDLVVMDVHLGRMGGKNAVAKAMDRMRGTPVILNTSFDAPEAHMLSWIADACVTKSSDLSELKEQIRKTLAQNMRKEMEAHA